MFDDWVTSATPRVDPHRAVLVGPERCAVEQVDETVAVGTDEGHVAGGIEKRGLQGRAVAGFGLGLAKAGGEADGTAGAAGAEGPHRLDGGMCG